MATSLMQEFQAIAAPSPPGARMMMKRLNCAAPARQSRALDFVDLGATRADRGAERLQSTRLMDSRFKPVDLTKEMAETYYYGRQEFKSDLATSDEPNLFWLDFVQWQESQGRSFLSHVSLDEKKPTGNSSLFVIRLRLQTHCFFGILLR